MLWRPIPNEWTANETAPVWRIVSQKPHTALGAGGAVIGLGLIGTLFPNGIPETMEQVAFPLVVYGSFAAMGLSEALRGLVGRWVTEVRFEEEGIRISYNKGGETVLPYDEIAKAEFTVPVPNTGKLKAPVLTLSAKTEKKLLFGNVLSLEAYLGLKAELERRSIRIVTPVWAEESFDALEKELRKKK